MRFKRMNELYLEIQTYTAMLDASIRAMRKT